MKLAQESALVTPAASVGGPEFLAPAQRAERCRQLAKQGYLVARVVQLPAGPADGPEAESSEGWQPTDNLPRAGQLRTAVEGAVEIALSLRGAPPPRDDEERDPRTAALAKLLRAYVVDAPGVCVVMPPLHRMTRDDGVMDLGDSELLRAYGEVAAEQPLVLLFDAGDEHVWTLAPQPLADVLAAVAPRSGPSAAIERSPGAALSLDAVQARDRAAGAEPVCLIPRGPTAARPSTAQSADELDDEADDAELTPLQPPVDALSADGDDDDVPEEDWADRARQTVPPDRSSDPLALQHATTLGRLFAELVVEEDDTPGGWLEDGSDDDEPFEQEGADRDELPPEGGLFAVPDEPPPNRGRLPAASDRGSSPDRSASPYVMLAEDEEEADEPGPRDFISDELLAVAPSAPAPTSPRRSPAGGPTPPRRAYSSGAALGADGCTRYARELEDAEGPQPVRMIEEMFRTRYTPLLEVLSTGVKHEAARVTTTRWRRAFEKSYGDGYTTMRLTGKRPRMVLDAPDLAVRLGRLNGARAVQLLLVDAMRFDLGQRIATVLKHRMADRAVCVDQTLLWSALPTITPTQLRLLARGPRGLREGEPQSERDPDIHRGRSVTTLRRVRIGRRDLLKLDVVEARLREAGERFDDRLADIADEVGAVISKFAATLPSRTLLYVFGDHGFRLEPAAKDGSVDAGTLPATQGGASPEEVLVPAYGWLVGKVH